MSAQVAEKPATRARNSCWLGLESVGDALTSLSMAVVSPRALGPAKLGHFAYVAWLAGVTKTLGGLGIPAATLKYMAEYLGQGSPGIARGVFRVTMVAQTAIACFLVLAGLILVSLFTEPGYGLMSSLVVIAILPGMIAAVPSQANVAAEDFSVNTRGSLFGNAIYVTVGILTLILHWDVAGVAASLLAMRVGEFLLRFIPALARVRGTPQIPLPAALRRRMFLFSRDGAMLLLLNILVWDRSEILFLKYLRPDIRELAFYATAFSITQTLLVLPAALAGPAGARLMVQYGRDAGQLPALLSTALRYLGLAALPLFFGTVALSAPGVALVFGPRFLPVAPVLVVAVLLAIPRAFLPLFWQVLQATEDQRYLVRWTLLSALINLSLDWLLIPRFGAIGAAAANGVTQLFATIGIVARARGLLRLELPLRFLGRVTLSSLVMSAAVILLAAGRSPGQAVFIGVISGVLIFFFMLRITGCLESQDRRRLLHLHAQMPRCLQSAFCWGLWALVPVADRKS